MKRVLIGITLLFAVSAHAVDLNNPKDAQYWQEIVFTVKQASHFSFDLKVGSGGANRSCYTTPEHFVACVQAIQALGLLLTPRQSLIPSADFGNPEWKDAQATQSMGSMVLVEGAPDPNVADDLKPQQLVALIQQKRQDLLEIGKAEIQSTSASGKVTIDFDDLADAMDAKRPADVPEGKLAVAIASGFSQGLDAHSHFDLTKLLKETAKNSDQSLTGIGITMGERSGTPLVVAPMPGYPAEKAGLKTGDLIVQILGDNQVWLDLKDVPLDKSADMIRGPENTTVHLKIQRAGDLLNFDIVRAHIVRKNVDVRVVDDISVDGKNMKIGLIKLRQFEAANGCDKIRAGILNLRNKENVEAFILDLRDNPGGFMVQAVCIGSLFAGRAPIVFEKNLQTGSIQGQLSDAPAVTDKPLVVMINSQSASASEIVAGAMQGLWRAYVVGDRSFGKASVQTGDPFSLDENLTYFQTTARFYVPYKTSAHSRLSIRTNQRVGVVPDFTVPFKPDATADELFSIREADEFPYALTAETTSWIPLRLAQVSAIQKCLDKNKRADTVYAQGSNAAQDYQLLKSEEVLACESSK